MALDVELYEGVLMLVFRGTVSPADIQSVADAVLQIEDEMSVAPPRLTDLSTANILEIGFDDIMALVLRRRATVLANHVRSAIVVGSVEQRGMARMFQTLNDHPRVTLHIFDDRETALAWVRGS